MDLTDALWRSAISVHKEARGGIEITAGMDERVLRWLESHLRSGMRTVETGCGFSTAIFAAQGTEHTCVSPYADEHRRISAWCEQEGIVATGVTFIEGRSDLVLPRLELCDLDLALIDGSHAFPHAFVDFWYMALALKPGGMLVIDDLQLWTGYVLHDFLSAQPGWDLVHSWAPRSAVFTKTGPIEELGAWTRQPYLVERSLNMDRAGIRSYVPLLRHRRYRWAIGRAEQAIRRRLARVHKGSAA